MATLAAAAAAAENNSSDWGETLGLNPGEVPITLDPTPEHIEIIKAMREHDIHLPYRCVSEESGQELLPYTPKIVLLFGASGSGKDIVADRILAEFGDDVLHLSADWYYGPNGLLDPEQAGAEGAERVFLSNYDHEYSVDWELLELHLDLLQQGYDVRIPRYDFTTHSRESGDGVLTSPQKIILVTGIMAAKLQDRADYTIGVEADFETCVERRIKRDVEERDRTRRQCIRQVELTVEPGYKRLVLPHLQYIRKRIAATSGKCPYMIVDNGEHYDDPSEAEFAEDFLAPIGELIEQTELEEQDAKLRDP